MGEVVKAIHYGGNLSVNMIIKNPLSDVIAILASQSKILASASVINLDVTNLTTLQNKKLKLVTRLPFVMAFFVLHRRE